MPPPDPPIDMCGITKDGTAVGEVTKLEVSEGDLRSGEERVMGAEVVEGDLSSREEGGLELELRRGGRVSAKITGGPAVSSLGLRIILLVGEHSPLAALGKLTAIVKLLVDPGASVRLLIRADQKLGLKFTEPDAS